MKLTSVVAGLFCGLLAGFSWSATPAEDLTGLLKPIETFAADFQQTLVSASGQNLQQVNGELKARRPGLFYWHTQAPLKQTIITDGEQVWLYDPDLEQVTIQTLSQQLSSTPALLLSGEVANIDEQFEVSARDTGNSDSRIFVLTPKSVDSLFDTLTLAFNQGILSAMELRDSLGQKTTLYFTNTQVNVPMEAKTFHFEIPPGVDVIRE